MKNGLILTIGFCLFLASSLPAVAARQPKDGENKDAIAAAQKVLGIFTQSMAASKEYENGDPSGQIFKKIMDFDKQSDEILAKMVASEDITTADFFNLILSHTMNPYSPVYAFPETQWQFLIKTVQATEMFYVLNGGDNTPQLAETTNLMLVVLNEMAKRVGKADYLNQADFDPYLLELMGDFFSMFPSKRAVPSLLKLARVNQTSIWYALGITAHKVGFDFVTDGSTTPSKFLSEAAETIDRNFPMEKPFSLEEDMEYFDIATINLHLMYKSVTATDLCKAVIEFSGRPGNEKPCSIKEPGDTRREFLASKVLIPYVLDHQTPMPVNVAKPWVKDQYHFHMPRWVDMYNTIDSGLFGEVRKLGKGGNFTGKIRVRTTFQK